MSKTIQDQIAHIEATYIELSEDTDEAAANLAEARALWPEPIHYLAGLKRIRLHDANEFKERSRYINEPMNPIEFLEFGLGKKDTIWPAVLPHYEELCSGEYVEAVLTGGIGTAKTTLAVFAQLYETYRILNLANPHKEFGLDPDSEIVIVFQSVTEGAARSVDYEFFRGILDSAPWFRDNSVAAYDNDLKSQIRFYRNVTVKPVSSLETAAIGQNVIGGIIDEINYLSIIQSSSRSQDGNVYDQAQVNYNAIARRRESRFMNQGYLAGMLCLVSSKRYPGQFTDRKIDQARAQVERTGKSKIYVYDKRVWDVRPEGSFGDKRFRVFVGERHLNPFIVDPKDYKEWPVDHRLIDEVPIEYRHSYEDDIHAALRDISGISAQLQHAYFTDMERLSGAFGHHKNIFNTEKSDFRRPRLAIRPKLFIDPTKPHYAHIDLGATADSAGLCIGHVDKFVEIERTIGTKEHMPLIVIDALLQIPPPRGGEIDFSRIRSILYRLRELGMNLLWVSYDSWQSRDSLQILKNEDFVVGVISMDRDTRAYAWTKRAIQDGRLLCPAHARCEHELRTLQYIKDKDKIDHLPGGSKDCADALAGTVYGLTMRREIWFDAGIPEPIIHREKDPKNREHIA